MPEFRKVNGSLDVLEPYDSKNKMTLDPTIIEILKSEHHRCLVNFESSKLQLKVAEEQLDKIWERVVKAHERLDSITKFCNSLIIELEIKE